MQYRLGNIIRELEKISNGVDTQRVDYYSLINLIVGLHTTYRINKEYAISDKIREVLNRSGIKIIQGTIGHNYEDIPENLKGRQFQDTWEFKDAI